MKRNRAAFCKSVGILTRVHLWVTRMVRHPYKQDPKRDLNLESYPNGPRSVVVQGLGGVGVL